MSIAETLPKMENVKLPANSLVFISKTVNFTGSTTFGTVFFTPKAAKSAKVEYDILDDKGKVLCTGTITSRMGWG